MSKNGLIDPIFVFIIMMIFPIILILFGIKPLTNQQLGLDQQASGTKGFCIFCYTEK